MCPPDGYGQLHPYARVIVDEAVRRGIRVEVVDPWWGELRLSYGGRSVGTRESLSELTNALALSRCQDKRITRRVLADAGLRIPRGRTATGDAADHAFLAEVGIAVVKPVRGAEGAGVTVGIRTPEALAAAVELARRQCPEALVEQMCSGQELRVLLIGYELVAAVLRRPASVTGDGVHTIIELLESENRTRAAVPGGRAMIPIDDTTRRVVHESGRGMDHVLGEDEVLAVRRTANMHTDLATGGSVRDVTADLHPDIVRACVTASRALGMPVTGLDLIVDAPSRPQYAIFDANERPGLSNYAPQPAPQRFIDLLFPETAGVEGGRIRLP